MSAANRDWSFSWPPSPTSRVLLWLPELPDSAIPSLKQAVERLSASERGRQESARTNDHLRICGLSDGAISITDDYRTATVRHSTEGNGGTVISVDLRPRRWRWERPSFDSMRYPFVVTLGALFVACLGMAGPDAIQVGVHRGTLALLVSMAASLWALWAFTWFGERRRRAARRHSHGFLDTLGTALFELGARPFPVNDSPFRR